MEIIQTVSAMRDRVGSWKRQGHRLVLVPTMGNLHPGHLLLAERALAGGERVVASIFVNSLQFGEGEDYGAYPRTLDADAEALTRIGVHALFAPSATEIYPRPVAKTTRVIVPGLSEILCGRYRPGHFAGVTTVVTQLFNIVQPDAAVFGEKDFQQLTVIRRMVDDLRMPLEIIGVPTVREPDGLAMSSRNVYLSVAERARAPQLYATLQTVARAIERGGRNFSAIEQQAVKFLRELGFRPDYVSVRRSPDLASARAGDADLVVLAAVWLGQARLIDNLRVVAQ